MADINTAQFGNSIIRRALNKEEFIDFLNKYNGAAHRRGLTKPSPSDFQIVKHLKTTHSTSLTAKKFGISVYQVTSAALRISGW